MLNQILWFLTLPFFLVIECVWIAVCIILFICCILSDIARGICGTFEHHERHNIFSYLSNYFFGTSAILDYMFILILPLVIWFGLTFIDSNWIDGSVFDEDE